MKKVGTLDYIKVLILTIFTVVVVLILANCYIKRNNYERENDDIMNFLSNIKYEELSNYLVEHHDGYIYMSPSSDSTFDEFEEQFKDYLLRNELEKEFVYLDSSNITPDMYNEFRNKYFASSLSNVTLNANPTLLVIREQKVVAVLNSNLTITSVHNFVSTYEVLQ